MPWIHVIWNDEPGGNVEHIAEHGITREEVQQVLENPETEHTTSESSGRPLAMGLTDAGRFIVIVYEQIDPATVLPITAYDPE